MAPENLAKTKSSFLRNNFNALTMNNWTSIRAVYLLMSLVLFIAAANRSWQLVIFVILMLNLGVWTKFCPSKWLFEKLGFKKCDL